MQLLSNLGFGLAILGLANAIKPMAGTPFNSRGLGLGAAAAGLAIIIVVNNVG
ncbi:MAG: hypothetical protein Q8Q88_04355 [Phenylobacterium sp.]|uniref:hypothetical protein n=1 Tax=Phenylobacterium sp. TaxID=1871053 RepID=UPI002733907C|nr:hypothetical protein [Phenylobacterium sp.]MDP3746263.1 hypothetical protein [Phenylobacterium sp.]